MPLHWGRTTTNISHPLDNIIFFTKETSVFVIPFPVDIAMVANIKNKM
jgi:hypothetical protein